MNMKRSITLLVGVLLLTVLMIPGPDVKVTAQGTATWQLVNTPENVCLAPRDPTVNRSTAYYKTFVRGRWSKPLTDGMTKLPFHSSTWTYYSPIAPGSSDGTNPVDYVAVHVNTDTPAGTYTLSLWASDGTSRQSVPVTLVVAEHCNRY
jgi:hypothetical protein